MVLPANRAFPTRPFEFMPPTSVSSGQLLAAECAACGIVVVLICNTPVNCSIAKVPTNVIGPSKRFLAPQHGTGVTFYRWLASSPPRMYKGLVPCFILVTIVIMEISPLYGSRIRQTRTL